MTDEVKLRDFQVVNSELEEAGLDIAWIDTMQVDKPDFDLEPGEYRAVDLDNVPDKYKFAHAQNKVTSTHGLALATMPSVVNFWRNNGDRYYLSFGYVRA